MRIYNIIGITTFVALFSGCFSTPGNGGAYNVQRTFSQETQQLALKLYIETEDTGEVVYELNDGTRLIHTLCDCDNTTHPMGHYTDNDGDVFISIGNPADTESLLVLALTDYTRLKKEKQLWQK